MDRGPSLMAQRVEDLPARQETLETLVRSLSQEDPLEKETATHSSILAWEIPWTEEPGGLQSMALQRVVHDLATTTTVIRLWKGQIICLPSSRKRSYNWNPNLSAPGSQLLGL